MLESLLTVGLSSNSGGGGWVSKSTTRTEPFNVLKQLQMVLAFVDKIWKSWEGNVMFERRMSSFGLLAEVNIPTPDRR